ncbi:hypothetical protein Mal15_36860 [Stieleria maiorica]|uniref:Uncharacterized protein n=2 Tax=Stieleria maiorica TaxID=2795974 RepID=A0A5B9MHZ8_9BACT|nr:hypothetical protein Mal15_36860 [Stieleria maiorica]
MVYLGWLGSHPLTILPKYLGQTVMTFWQLARHRPGAVFVMSPPLFAALPALLWKWIFRTPFVLDCHTGAYTNRRWRHFQWLQHFLGRQAAANIVTNNHLKELVEEHGGTAVIVRDVPVVFETTENYPLSDGFNVAAVCSFNYDEPISEMFKAAEQLDDTSFYFTGNPKHLSAEVASQKPDNVRLTGFLSDQEYGSLLQQADVVLTLTTQDHTMLRGAWESIYQGTPVIVSDWGILKTSFDRGAVHVDNTCQSIVNAIRYAQSHRDDLRNGAISARNQRIERWQEVKRVLIEKTNS